MKEHLLVYLVDDDEDDRIFFEEALSEISISNVVMSFSNGVDLIAQLLKSTERLPDMLFIDLNMPLMNGEECIADIRADHRFLDIPIIVYSSYIDYKQLSDLRALGANRLLQKPNTFKQLRKRLKGVLSSLALEDSKKEKEEVFLVD